MKTLEERLGKVPAEDFEKLKLALQVPHINPREDYQSMPYLKVDLVDRIINYLSKINPVPNSFRNALYHGKINWKPLKRVIYGKESVGTIPQTYFGALTDYEKIYWLVGRWFIRKPDLTQSIELLTASHIYEGLNNLHELHFKQKAKRKYKRSVKLPESDIIRRNYWEILEESKKPKIAKQLNLF